MSVFEAEGVLESKNGAGEVLAEMVLSLQKNGGGKGSGFPLEVSPNVSRLQSLIAEDNEESRLLYSRIRFSL